MCIQYSGSNLQHKYGWISPDGEWFGCPYMEHSQVANAIAKVKFADEIHRKPNAEQVLEEHGYVKITKSVFGGRRVEIFPGSTLRGDGDYITARQAEKIRELGYGEELEYINPIII